MKVTMQNFKPILLQRHTYSIHTSEGLKNQNGSKYNKELEQGQSQNCSPYLGKKSKCKQKGVKGERKSGNTWSQFLTQYQLPF